MMNHRMPPAMSGNLNGPPLSVQGMINLPGPMMDSGNPMMHGNPYGLPNMIPNHVGPHQHERELLLSSGIPIGSMGPGPHGGMPHLGPHMMHPHHPHHGHPGLQMYGRPTNPYLNSTDSRISEFNRRLQQRNEDCDNIWWDTFITEFFEEDATLTITYNDEGPKRYTLGRTLIPRYFRSIFESGCTEYYFFLRSVRESFHTQNIVVESESAQMVMTYSRAMPPTSITVEGRLVLDFTCDELMRIRNWNFQIRSHREFVLRSMPGLMCSQDLQQIRDILSINITRCGIPNQTMNLFRICPILEPMQELMSRQKAYNLSPRDCLKTTLFQKWQRMVAPPGQQPKSGLTFPPALSYSPSCHLESGRQTNKRRKRKGSSANSDTASGRSSKRKQSPVPSLPNLNQPGDVMIVGEPTLMGGEFGDEDERSITRLENTQYDSNGNSLMSQCMPGALLGGGGQYQGTSLDQRTPYCGSQSESKAGDLSQLSSSLNGSLNNLLKSTDSRPQYPGTCSTPSSKETINEEPQFRGSGGSSKSGGEPPRPTSQGANPAPAFQEAVFGFTTDNLLEFTDKSGDIVAEQPRPISEPLPTISGPANQERKASLDP